MTKCGTLPENLTKPHSTFAKSKTAAKPSVISESTVSQAP